MAIATSRQRQGKRDDIPVVDNLQIPLALSQRTCDPDWTT